MSKTPHNLLLFLHKNNIRPEQTAFRACWKTREKPFSAATDAPTESIHLLRNNQPSQKNKTTAVGSVAPRQLG